MDTYFKSLLEASLLCGSVVLLIVLVSPLLKKKHTFYWRYLLWIALGIRLVLPFDISVPKPAITISLPAHIQQEGLGSGSFAGNTRNAGEKSTSGNLEILEAQDTKQDTTIEGSLEEKQTKASVENKARPETKATTGSQENLAPSAPSKTPFPFWKLLFACWVGVAALLFLFQVGSYWIFCKKLRNTRNFVFQHEEVSVFSSSLVQSPLLFGIGKPQILLPEQEYTQEQLAFILKHEYMHYKRKDLWMKLLLAVARTLHWFNPFVYLMEKRAGEDMELLCDSQVVCGLSREEKKRYGEMLLACASKRSYGHGVLCASEFSNETKKLKERFANLFSNEGRKKGVLVAILGIVVLIFVSSFIAFGSKKQEPAPSNPISSETPKPSQEPQPSDEAADEVAAPEPLQELSLEKAANSIYGAVFPQLIYASSQRAILYDYWGLMVYDIEHREIEQLLDLPAAGFGHSQGSDATHIEVSKNGKQLLFYHEDNKEECYLYHIDEKKLECSDANALKGNCYEGLGIQVEESYALTEDGKKAYLTQDSLITKDGDEFSAENMQSLSLVVSDRRKGDADVYPLFREYYEAQGETAFPVDRGRDVKIEVIGEEYLYQDKEGWQYYLEEDKMQESPLQDVAPVLDPLLLVRYKDGERQILEDLMVQYMYEETPVLFADGRIVYSSAAKADIISVKTPSLVSIAMDGSDRRVAEDISHNVVNSICEDGGWIYYSGWTNDGAFPRPLCRIPADFSTGPLFVEEISGLLCGVKDGYVFYLADDTKKSGIWRRNLKTGQEQIYDKWGWQANNLHIFRSRESWFEPGTLREEGCEGCHIIYAAWRQTDPTKSQMSLDYYFCDIPFYDVPFDAEQ